MQMCTAIYQNRLALDYLLAEEGGVCSKFNNSNCCIDISDSGEAVQSIASEIRKIAHVPVQTWKGIDTSWFGSLFSGLGGLKTLVGVAGLMFLSCMLLPCFLPLCVRSINSTIDSVVERKTAAHVMPMWEYQALGKKDPDYMEEECDA